MKKFQKSKNQMPTGLNGYCFKKYKGIHCICIKIEIKENKKQILEEFIITKEQYLKNKISIKKQ